MATGYVQSLYALGASVVDAAVAWRGVGGRLTKIDGTPPTLRPLAAHRDGALMTVPSPDSLDAFGRARVSTVDPLWVMKHTFDANPDLMVTKVDNVASTAAYDSATASVIMTTRAAANGRVVRQSRQYIPYQPGRSHLIFATFLFGSAVANVTRQVGLFDDSNGVFFQQNGTTNLRFVVRKGASDTATAQSSWNLDKLDGTGSSGITLDVTKVQLLVIDLAWLGVGQVRFGFNISGRTIWCHASQTANSGTSVYMASPSLPIRWEINNNAATSSNTMSEICGAVFSEGGGDPSTGFPLAASTSLIFPAGMSITPAANSRALLTAVRLKTAYTRAQLIPHAFEAVTTSAGTCAIELWLAPETAFATVPAAGVWVSLSTATEGAPGNAAGWGAFTTTSARLLASTLVSNSTRSSATVTQQDLRVGADVDGVRDYLVLATYDLGSRPTVAGAELELLEVY